MNIPIQGYYGCPCHPFESFEELKFYEKQKLSEGQIVKMRHTEKFAFVIRKYSDGTRFYHINVFPCKHGSDITLEHVTNLIPESKMSKIDLEYIATGVPSVKNQKSIDLHLKSYE